MVKPTVATELLYIVSTLHVISLITFLLQGLSYAVHIHSTGQKVLAFMDLEV